MSELAVWNCRPTRHAGRAAAPAQRPRIARTRHHPRWRHAGARRPHRGHRARAPKSSALTSPDAEVVDAGGRIVLPGFVDAHTHPVFAGNRADEFEQRIEGATYAEIAARGGGIRSTVRSTRAATEEELLARRAALSRMVPPRRHDHHRSQIRLRPVARIGAENSAGHPRASASEGRASLRADFSGRARNPRRVSRPHRRIRRHS